MEEPIVPTPVQFATWPNAPDPSFIRLRHPRTDSSFAIFRLSPLPGIEHGGLPFFLVLESAKILANNKPGALVRTVPGKVVSTEDVEHECLQPTDICATLVAGDYWYFVKEGNGYSTAWNPLESFRQWTMPPELPSYWTLNPPKEIECLDSYLSLRAGAEVEGYVTVHDRRCLITGSRTRLQASPLIPAAKTDWYQRNAKMFPNVPGTGGAANFITLRFDLNADSFEEGDFVIVPFDKAQAPVIFFIHGGSFDAINVAHGKIVDLPARIDLHLLYVRLAINVFEGPAEKPRPREDGASDADSEMRSRGGKRRKLNPPSEDSATPEPMDHSADSSEGSNAGALTGVEEESDPTETYPILQEEEPLSAVDKVLNWRRANNATFMSSPNE
ncbi:hypothetical protein B0H16DRAFT_858384 [Mycena metata]|uniref:Uncharacterized protein n=1 Tax=Mycena metata TaxID=1033252 RepID=A0AAD7N8B9_9AGAR|nr:hypothetical protein B0H16DRAFT_858384 [Mycena metata]